MAQNILFHRYVRMRWLAYFQLARLWLSYRCNCDLNWNRQAFSIECAMCNVHQLNEWQSKILYCQFIKEESWPSPLLLLDIALVFPFLFVFNCTHVSFIHAIEMQQWKSEKSIWMWKNPLVTHSHTTYLIFIINFSDNFLHSFIYS